MKIFLKFEKTFIFIIKIFLFFILTLVFFTFFSNTIPQIKKINRTFVISVLMFFASIYTSTKLYGDVAIGKKSTKEIRDSAILGTFIADFSTFTTLHIMNISSTNYQEFSEKYFIENNSSLKYLNEPKFSTFLFSYMEKTIFPSFLTFAFCFLTQIFIIYIFIKTFNIFYFKINKPKNILIIYDNKKTLIYLVSKIKKNSFKWCIKDIINFNDKNILKKINKNDVIFFSNIPKNSRTFLLKYCYKHNKKIYIYPDIYDIMIHCSSINYVDDITFYSITDYKMSLEQIIVKRIGDIIFATVALILTTPICLISAIAIKLYDKGPIIFKQKRLTINGKEFNLLKFRSMIVNTNDYANKHWAKKDDFRITPIGKIMRKFRIDEIPQFLNILKGDLSVVGPRPETSELVEKFQENLPEFKYRLKVKAGLTGLAQVMGKYSTTPKDKLILDLSYIQKYSLWLDIKIIIKTLIIFLKTDTAEGISKIEKSTVDFIKQKLNTKNSKQY